MISTLSKSHVAVVGLDYVGMPLATMLAKHMKVSGSDRNGEIDGPLCINDAMPLHSATHLKAYFGDDLNGCTIAFMGVSYLNDVADTRYSPSDYFVTACEKEGAKLIVHDPLVSYWPEKSFFIETHLSDVKGREACDALVLAVRHSEYRDITAQQWCALFPNIKVVLDTNNILSNLTAADFRALGIDVLGIGKGHWTVSTEKKKKTA